jgi:cell division protein FtsN
MGAGSAHPHREFCAERRQSSGCRPGPIVADAPEGASAKAPSQVAAEAPPASHKGAPTVADTRRAATARATATATATAHGHFVQLGAFHSKEQAQTQWKQLAAKFPSELKSLKPDYVEGQSKHGALVRLRVPMSSVAAAKGLCGTLKKHAQSCVPLTV